jgi:hypothetical protein
MLRARGEVVPRRDNRDPQDEERVLARQPAAARRRRLSRLLAADQGRADAPWLAAPHKTWMAEDGIPEILAEQRLGHDVPGMRGLYAHASQRMREELLAALQARWEGSLRERAGIDPHSPVPLLDRLLAPFRDRTSRKPEQTASRSLSRVPMTT